MKILLIAAAVLVASVHAELSGGYGAPGIVAGSPSGFGSSGFGAAGSEFGASDAGAEYQSQTYKHVYVHSAPDEATDVQSKTIRVPGGDKHVNIIFVKTPSQSSQQNTEVILPEQDQHKNLVYVLLKKAQATSDVKIRGPSPTQPSKPDVYFIRYKDQGQGSTAAGGYSGASGAGASAPLAPVQTPSAAYGVY